MTEIIDFVKYNNTKIHRSGDGYNRSRIRALAKGQIQAFNCDSCGVDFEVYYGEFPDKCPGCGLTFDWDKSLKRKQ